MSCSKMFSGDLPELTYEVIKYFQNDYSTLHSCILVNRLWCRLAIPLLWENPFSIPTENYHFIDIYLNDDLKTKLNEHKIIINSLPSNTLFNYPSFLKYLNTYNFILSIEKWLELYTKTYDVNWLSSICVLLLTIFIENEVNLHTLEIEVACDNPFYIPISNDILELILQNPNFIHNIRNLKLSISYFYKNTVINDHILQIIHSHQNLKRISLDSDYLPLYESLLLSKDYNCSNTLNTIIFYCINFKGIINLVKIFEQLKVLESIHIIYCFSLNTSFTEQIVNLTKPFKLKSLFIREIPQIESLQLLLQKSCNYLENFGVYSNYGLSSILSQQLFELVIKYCKNIKFLYFFGIYETHITYQILYLIESINQNLNYLTIYLRHNTECGLIILQNLGQLLPSKLEYLCLNLHHIKASDFEVFLKNSQNTFIKKLLICYYNDDRDILPLIKEYIMKKKRVKYLAIIESYRKAARLGHTNEELFSFKDEVKEFELYNIKVQDFHSLAIMVYDYIMKID